MPTLAQGQADDLKFEDGGLRVWVSRCGLEDFELDPVKVEHLIDGRWVDVTRDRYRDKGVHVIGQALGIRAGIGWHRPAQ